MPPLAPTPADPRPRLTQRGRRVRLGLGVAFLALFVITAIRPWHPQDFIVEHVLTALAIAALIRLDRRAPFSTPSVVVAFVFGVLHLIGAHYTYSEVPYDTWATSMFGSPLSEWFGWDRNHYDRLVHLSFGLLFTLPMREMLARAVPELRPRDPRLLMAAVLVIAVISKLYELLEWSYTFIMSHESAAMYNGEQGDRYDAHKDMALALVGAIGAALVIAVAERRRSDRS